LLRTHCYCRENDKESFTKNGSWRKGQVEEKRFREQLSFLNVVKVEKR